MGVTYKLTENVVQFILQQKQDNPSISCRKLVDILQESFQLNVSKSSINTIIKEANLSNPVGRTPLQTSKTPKFKIPTQKKTELFEKAKPTLESMGVKDSGPAVLIQSAEREDILPLDETKAEQSLLSLKPAEHPVPSTVEKDIAGLAIETEEIILLPNAPVVNGSFKDSALNGPADEEIIVPPVAIEAPLVLSDQPEDIGEELADETRVSLLPDPVQQTAAAPSAAVEYPSVKEGSDVAVPDIIQVSRLDDILLRSALWDLSRRPFLEGFLKHNTDLTVEDIQIIDTLLCFGAPVFEEPLQALDEDRAWLWRVSGFPSPPTSQRIQALITRIKNITVSDFDFSLEASYFFSVADEVRMVLRDQSVVSLNARLSVLKNTDFACPADNTVEKVSEFMTDRSAETVLKVSLPADVEEFKNFVSACEGEPSKKIEKMIIMNDGKEISEFSAVPDFKRKFFVAARMSKAEFEGLFNTAIVLKSENVIQERNRTVYWADLTIDLIVGENALKLRAVVFSGSISGEELECGFAPPSAMPTQEFRLLINSNIIQSIEKYNVSDVSASENEPPFDDFKDSRPLVEFLQYIKTKIAIHAKSLFQSHELASDNVITVLNTGCCVKLTEKCILVELKPQENLSQSLSERLVRKVNAYKINDYMRRALEFEIK